MKNEEEYAKLKKEEHDKTKKTCKRCAFGSSNSSTLKTLQYSEDPGTVRVLSSSPESEDGLILL